MRILDAYRYYDNGRFITEMDGSYNNYDTVREAMESAVNHITALMDNVVDVDDNVIEYINNDGKHMTVVVCLYNADGEEITNWFGWLRNYTPYELDAIATKMLNYIGDHIDGTLDTDELINIYTGFGIHEKEVKSWF